MNPDREETEVFLDTESQSPVGEDEEKEEGEAEEEEEEEEEEDEEEDAKIFDAWMKQFRSGERQEKIGEEEGEGERDGGRSESRSSEGPPVRTRMDRRASLPCPATLSAMQLSRLHSSTRAPVSARVLLHHSASRRHLPSSQEASAPNLERRPSLIPTIPEVVACERRSTFRRRNVMSLSDADSVCLICHNDLNRGSGGKTELQCTHTFHKECIEEWLWRKHSCPTCHVQVSVQQPVYWSSTRVKVP